MKKSNTKSNIKTLKLYEAIFVGATILILLFIILNKFVTPLL